MARNLKPVSPGEILLMEFLNPLGINQSRLARDLNVPVRRVNDIVRGKRAITVAPSDIYHGSIIPFVPFTKLLSLLAKKRTA